MKLINKNSFTFIFLFLINNIVFTQIKIGNNPTNINANSVLELESVNKGFLLPRLALSLTTNASPLNAHVAGMSIYNTASAGDVTPGYYYNDGSKWIRIGTQADGSETKINAGSNISVTGSGTSINPYQISATSNTYTSSNGISVNANNFKLGGSLIEATIIDQGSNSFSISGSVPLTIANTNATVNAVAPSTTVNRLQRTGTLTQSYAQVVDFNIGKYGSSTSAQTQFDINLSNGLSSSASTTIMSLQGNGNVGIGTTSPTEKLDVSGNIKFSGALMPNNLAGASGQVLTSAGSGAAPTWTTLPTAVTYTGSTSTVLNGTSFERAALTGDVTASQNSNTLTISNNAITSAKILDGTIATADLANGSITAAKLNQMSATNGQSLVWNGTTWAPTTVTFTETDGVIGNEVTDATVSGGLSRSGSGTAVSPYTLGVAAGGITNTMLAADAVTSAKILDGTIATADVANSAITGAKIENNVALPGTASMTLPSGTTAQRPVTAVAGMSRYNTTDNIMEYYNGTAWVRPTAGTTYTGSTSTVLNGTSFERAALTGDVTAIQNSNILTIANDAITTAKILDETIATADLANGSVTAAKLNQMAATSGQSLVWNGTTWAPSTVTFTEVDGVIGNEVTDVTVSGGLSRSGSGTAVSPYTLGVATGGISTAMLADGSVTATKLNQMSATSGQVLKWNGTTWSPASDDNTTADGSETKVTAGTNVTITGTGTTASPYVVNASGAADATTTSKGIVQLAGDLSGTAVAPSVVKLQGQAVSATAPISGQSLVWDGTEWTPTTSISSNIYNSDGVLSDNRIINQGANTLSFTSSATTGTSHFTIDGTTLNIDALNNRIGIGTSTPTTALTLLNDGGGSGVNDDFLISSYGGSTAAGAPTILMRNARGTIASPSNLSNGDVIGNLVFSHRSGGNFFNSSSLFAFYKGNGTTNLSDLNLSTSGITRMTISENGSVLINNLSGVGSRMVVADATGVLSTQTLPTAQLGSTSVVLNGNSFERAALTGDVIASQNSNALSIASNAVTSTKILDGTIATADVANSAITGAKLENNIALPGTASTRIPTGTTSQRPSSPLSGMIRFNTSLQAMEYFDGSSWSSLTNSLSPINLYTTDGSLSGNRNVFLGANSLTFTSNGFGPLFQLNTSSSYIALRLTRGQGGGSSLEAIWDLVSGATGASREFAIEDVSNARGGLASPLRIQPGLTGNFLILPTGTGNVGIGTGTPDEKLRIVGGNVRVDNTSRFVVSGSGGIQAAMNDGLSIAVSSMGGGVILETNGAERIRLTHGGLLGIGTTTPTSTAQINGTFALNTATSGVENSVVLLASGTFSPPTASTFSGRIYIIRNTSAATNVTVASVIDYGATSAASFTLTPALGSIMIISDGTSWFRIQ